MNLILDNDKTLIELLALQGNRPTNTDREMNGIRDENKSTSSNLKLYSLSTCFYSFGGRNGWIRDVKIVGYVGTWKDN